MNISIFNSITSKLPVQGSLEGVASLIRTDEKLKAFTASYRQTGSKTFKQECPLFAVACILDGGKAQDNIKQLTGLSLVDFDHIFNEEQRVKSKETRYRASQNQAPSLISPGGGEASNQASHPQDEANKVSPPPGETEERAKRLAALKAKIIADPHTLMCYTTISGNGLRVIYKYEPAQNSDEFYQQAFFAGNAYYERLLGIKADPQCKNVTRLSGLAHDPGVFLRPEPETIAFSVEEIAREAAVYAKQSKEDKQMRRIQTYYDTLIAPQLEKDGILFQPGSHNSYVMRVGYKLAERRFSKAVAIKWAKRQFAAYPDTEQVFTSCFANATPRDGDTGGGFKGDTKTATVDEIKSFLDSHIKLRYNEITARVEYSPLSHLPRRGEASYHVSPTQDEANHVSPPPGETEERAGERAEDCWLPINDRRVNSLWAEMSAVTRVNKQDIYSIIESDYVPPFNPFRAYFERLTRIHTDSTERDAMSPTLHAPAPSLISPEGGEASFQTPQVSPPYDGAIQVSPPPGETEEGARKESQSHLGAIHKLAQTVRVKGGEQEQLRWEHYLRKWLVAMVASWLDDGVVNNVILVLIGEQGSFKTTWFNYLLPPPLKRYFYTKTNANRMSKDDLLTLAQYALVCCEELDTMRPSELNQLKAVVTMPTIDERAAYAHFHEHRQHIASFCGTGNNPQFLSDPTGNRRWLPFEVEHIVSPRDHPFDHDAVYAEAYALYRGGFRFWFEREEIQELNAHNREFETPHLERELVDLYFRKPVGQESGIFMTAARALQIIGSNVSQKLSAAYIGRAFTDLGFIRIRGHSQRGYLVVQRSAEEIRAFEHRLAFDAETE